MFNLDDDLMRQLRATFKIEASEHIQALNRVLLILETDPDSAQAKPLLEEIFREAHSLKGAAGAADFAQVESTAHKLESVFSAAKNGRIQLTPEVCDVLYAAIDAVTVIIEAALEQVPHGVDLPELYTRLEAVENGLPIPGARPQPVETPKPIILESAVAKITNAQPSALIDLSQVPDAMTGAVPKTVQPEEKPKAASANGKEGKARTGLNARSDDTIRVATNKIDSLMTQSGELLVAGLKIDQRLNDVNSIRTRLEDWNREWLKLRAANSGLFHDGDRERMRPVVKLLDANQETLRSLVTMVNELKRGFAGDALHLARVTNDLSEGVMRVRMLPVSNVFDAFPRLVRDVARDQGKEVELKTEGAETELDRKVMEAIKDPLLHLLRNSVDHGIEKPEERVRNGKPAQGTITLRAFQKGNNIVIEIQDDGAGINRTKVKQAALKAGLITADEMAAVSDEDALRFIFAPGLSTSGTITDISGRGVGMDVVRRNVEALQGQVDVESTLGKGTRIALTLPLTLATTQELLVQVGQETYGIPISAVERIRRITANEISSVQGKQAIVVDDEPVSLVRLAQVLERPAMAEQEGGTDKKMPVVILDSGRRRVAFLVDAVVGQQESVVKTVGKQLSRVRNVAGATILGSGQVIITLNPVDLMKSVRGVETRYRAAEQAKTETGKKEMRANILVVDDSLSTRTLEKNILETAGYKVMLATDGQEALNMLTSNSNINLIVSDIIMPHMDGLALTAMIKQDPNLKRIPVVLVTSLDSRTDKERGIQVGADAYIIKSNFDQSNLLDTIKQLV